MSDYCLAKAQSNVKGCKISHMSFLNSGSEKHKQKCDSHIWMTRQLSLSFQFQQHMHEQACPCVLLPLLSWLGRFPSKSKANSFACYMRNEDRRNFFLLCSSLELISNGKPTGNRHSFSLKCADRQKSKKNMDSYIFPHDLEVSEEFLEYTQYHRRLCM